MLLTSGRFQASNALSTIERQELERLRAYKVANKNALVRLLRSHADLDMPLTLDPSQISDALSTAERHELERL